MAIDEGGEEEAWGEWRGRKSIAGIPEVSVMFNRFVLLFHGFLLSSRHRQIIDADGWGAETNMHIWKVIIHDICIQIDPFLPLLPSFHPRMSPCVSINLSTRSAVSCTELSAKHRRLFMHILKPFIRKAAWKLPNLISLFCFTRSKVFSFFRRNCVDALNKLQDGPLLFLKTFTPRG